MSNKKTIKKKTPAVQRFNLGRFLACKSARQAGLWCDMGQFDQRLEGLHMRILEYDDLRQREIRGPILEQMVQEAGDDEGKVARWRSQVIATEANRRGLLDAGIQGLRSEIDQDGEVTVFQGTESRAEIAKMIGPLLEDDNIVAACVQASQGVQAAKDGEIAKLGEAYVVGSSSVFDLLGLPSPTSEKPPSSSDDSRVAN